MIQAFSIGIGCGIVALFGFRHFRLRALLKEANEEAGYIRETAEGEAEIHLDEAEEQVKEITKQLEEDTETLNEKYRPALQLLETKFSETEEHHSQEVYKKERYVKRRKKSVNRFSDSVTQLKAHLEKRKEQRQKLKDDLVTAIEARSQVNVSELKMAMGEDLVTDQELRAQKMVQRYEEEIESDVERLAKRVINVALNRFARPYCGEKGQAYTILQNNKARNNVLGRDQANLPAIEKACGIDLIYNEERSQISVSGFDPVRRQLGNDVIESLIRRPARNPAEIEHIVDKVKKKLFSRIRQDGNRIAKELSLHGLHPEIRNMMGALRYRFSFAQNQYFHCGEVGFLCGLLGAELGLDIKKCRRAGMLHDIGKAMDHSVDGGHAVLGADFIMNHDEEEDIVHAVRAHHFDETPSTDMAYLVIAADALSGARPGARRSTADSYMQKMGQLEEIGNSFKGVHSTYIMSAGREVRIILDSKRMSDQDALTLSQQISKKIEEECSYPGLIKVTVVRQTQAVEMAR